MTLPRRPHIPECSIPKPIFRPAHAFTDHPCVAAATIAPTVLGFQDEPAAVRMTRVLAGMILGSSILTRAEWGFVRVMPYRIHLLLNALGGLTALSVPWLFGFSRNAPARNTFVAQGLSGLGAGLLSQPDELPETF